MSGFSADWLDMRRPFDDAARNRNVFEKVCRLVSSTERPRILDLASGSGATLAAFESVLEVSPRWTLTDSDSGLLEIAHQRFPEADIRCINLESELEDLDLTAFDFVTTSAFFDLVSTGWMERFAKRLTDARIPLYAALTYDGRHKLTPADPDDAQVFDAFNRHQRTDKGFGPALGPGATQLLNQFLKNAGYMTHGGQSDWRTGPSDFSFVFKLLSGILDSATEIEPDRDAELNQWFRRRIVALEKGQLSVRVGHLDLFAVPGP